MLERGRRGLGRGTRRGVGRERGEGGASGEKEEEGRVRRERGMGEGRGSVRTSSWGGRKEEGGDGEVWKGGRGGERGKGRETLMLWEREG